MNFNDQLFTFDFKINKQYLVNVWNNKYSRIAEPYTDERYPGKEYKEWLIARADDDRYALELMNLFDVEGKPRFYRLAPNVTLPMHTDLNTTCSINFIINDNNASVILEDKNQYYYQCGLLDTSRYHSVKNNSSERLLFKISIFNETFDCIQKKIQKVVNA